MLLSASQQSWFFLLPSICLYIFSLSSSQSSFLSVFFPDSFSYAIYLFVLFDFFVSIAFFSSLVVFFSIYLLMYFCVFSLHELLRFVDRFYDEFFKVKPSSQSVNFTGKEDRHGCLLQSVSRIWTSFTWLNLLLAVWF